MSPSITACWQAKTIKSGRFLTQSAEFHATPIKIKTTWLERPCSWPLVCGFLMLYLFRQPLYEDGNMPSLIAIAVRHSLLSLISLPAADAIQSARFAYCFWEACASKLLIIGRWNFTEHKFNTPTPFLDCLATQNTRFKQRSVTPTFYNFRRCKSVRACYLFFYTRREQWKLNSRVV